MFITSAYPLLNWLVPEAVQNKLVCVASDIIFFRGSDVQCVKCTTFNIV